MNRTIALPAIAARVAELAGVDADTASRFILGLFGAAEQEIAAGRQAEIPGIGTFSRSDGATVLFTPADELADAVNAPFALFSAVSIPADAPANIFSADDEYRPQEPAEEHAEEVSPPEFTMTPPTAPDEPVPVVEPDAEPQSREPFEAEKQPMHTDEAPEPQYIYVERRNHWPWIVAILCLLAGFAAGFCYGKHSSGPYFSNPDRKPVPLDTAVAADDSVNVYIQTLPIDTDTVTPDTLTATPTPDEPEAEEPVYDTVGTTRFLTTIARDHYGRKDYWVFIYDANSANLPHPNRIHPGTRVLVPSLGPHAATDSATRAHARQLAAEFYRRYNL